MEVEAEGVRDESKRGRREGTGSYSLEYTARELWVRGVDAQWMCSCVNESLEMEEEGRRSSSSRLLSFYLPFLSSFDSLLGHHPRRFPFYLIVPSLLIMHWRSS